jgi:hypothetical protein|nr:MAG TPA: hypothetical protein [Caudoviricetes sp.]
MAEAKGATEVVIDLMNKNGFTPAVLGKRIGVKNTAIWDRLYNSKRKERGTDDMKVGTMTQMLRGMDYKLVAVPMNKKVMSDEYELK